MIPFVGFDYKGRTRANGQSRAINCYPESVDDPQAKSRFLLIGTPGTSSFSNMGELGVCRGLHATANGQAFGVYGSSLVEFESNGTYNIRGDIGTLANPVSFADNGYYIIMADGVKMWSYKLATNTLAEVTLGDFTNPTTVIFYKQRFWAINQDPTATESADNVPNNNKVYFSEVGPDGGLTWPSLNFFSTESTADANTGLAVAGGNIWIFGTRSFEIFRVTANPDAPASLIGGTASEMGCSARYSVATIGSSVFWLGSSKAGKNQVFMSNGLQAQVISDNDLDFRLGEIADTSDAQSFCYQQEGHVFYVLSFMSGDKTYVYDVTEGGWHERQTRELNTNVRHRWAPIYSMFAFEKVLVGFNNSQESPDSLLLELDLDKYDEWDYRPIVRYVESPELWNDLRPIFFDEIMIEMDVGNVQQTGQGSAPLITIGYSNDGGYTWNNERIVSMPLIGQYRGIVRTQRLGSSRRRKFSLQYSEPNKFVILGASAKTRGSNAW